MLSRRQYELLAYICQYISGHGYAPSMREMSAATGKVRASSSLELLRRLEAAGYIRRVPGLARGLEVLKPLSIKRSARSTQPTKRIRR
jgi:repressor LexA